jgi:hypothetical protein
MSEKLTAPTRLTGLGKVHPAWWVAGVGFLALLAAAGFRAAPGALMVPLIRVVDQCHVAGGER